MNIRKDYLPVYFEKSLRHILGMLVRFKDEGKEIYEQSSLQIQLEISKVISELESQMKDRDFGKLPDILKCVSALEAISLETHSTNNKFIRRMSEMLDSLTSDIMPVDFGRMIDFILQADSVASLIDGKSIILLLGPTGSG
jgi:hypothetical protein